MPDCAADSGDLFAAVAGAARILGHVCAPSLQQLTVARCADVRPDLEAYDRNRRTLYEALTAYGASLEHNLSSSAMNRMPASKIVNSSTN